ncbi:DUF3352 domain-containing protein [Candidatus Poribacteria bacterium]
MSRKNLAKISITSVIAILLIAQTVTAQQAVSSPGSLREVTPDKPLIFKQLTGASGVMDMDSNFWKQVAQAPFWEIAYAELEVQSKVKDIHLAIEPGISLLSYIFGEDIVFVLPEFGVITEISPLLMLRLKSVDDGLGKIIANSIKIALTNVAQTTSQYGGHTITAIPMPGDAPFVLSCALLDDVFAIGLGDKTLKKVIDLMNGSEGAKSITEDAGFSSVVQKLPLPDNNTTGQYLGIVHVNLAPVVAFVSAFYPMVQGNIPAEIEPVVRNALKWLDLVPAVSWVAATTDEGIVLQAYTALNPNATSQNFLKMLQTEPERLGAIAFVPEDAIGYSGTNLMDLKLIWSMAYDTLSDLPGIGEQVPGQLEQLEQGLGFDFEEDLLSWMGNEIGYVYNEVSTVTQGSISEKLCLIIEVTDKEKAQAGLQKLIDVGIRLSEGQFTTEERDYMDETIHELEDMPLPITPGYALVGDYLLISPSSAYIEKLIDCAAGRAEGLDANPRFQAVKNRWPEKANSMQFFDARQYLKVMMDSIGAQIEEGLIVVEDDTNMQQAVINQCFELVDILSHSLGASIGFTVNDGAGLRSNSLIQIRDLESVIPISDSEATKIARNLYIANRYKEAEMPDRAMERYTLVLDLDEGNRQANMAVAEILAEQDKNSRARYYLTRIGFVPEDAWYVIGPFENDMGEGFGTQYPPEEDIELDAEYEVAEGSVKVRWQKQTDGTADGFVDLMEIVEPDQWAVAYAWVKVISEEAQEVELRVGSDDQIIVWLNGAEVISHRISRQARPDQNIVAVTLNQGENQLLVKVCNEEMNWGFYLRFTDADGKPLKGLEFGE